jgi:outer membrane immunogenic protein
MKRLKIGTFLIINCLAITAVNAETDWAGYYAGLSYGQYHNDIGGRFDSAGSDYNLSGLDTKDNSFGIQVGYNYQMGNFVIGAEADYTPSNMDNSEVDSESDEQEFETENFYSLRARAGYAINKFLIYGTAGIAHMESELKTENSTDKTTIDGQGAVFGVGVEYAVSDRFSMKLEYLDHDFSEDKNLDLSHIDDSDSGDNISVDDVTAYRLGVNYQF